MRLWSIHPQYLDPVGLVALWREALLARAVIAGLTRGYTNHPQLARFYAHPQPLAAINRYLLGVHQEATTRGYRFDPQKLVATDSVLPISVTDGQVMYEWAHLRGKLAARSPAVLARQVGVTAPQLHPLFVVTPGAVEPWEKIL